MAGPSLEDVVSHCAASAYPRSLRGVLSRADAAHLEHLYFKKIQQRYPLRYYGLLHHLGHAPDKQFHTTLGVLRRLQARVRAEVCATISESMLNTLR